MRYAVLSLDVEDWYHLEYFQRGKCDRKWSLLDGFDVYSEIIAELQVPSSYFVLGELSRELKPRLRDVSSRGDDIGSHGWNHVLPMRMGLDDFSNDLLRSKGELESVIGREVSGYRAPCFSIDRPRLDRIVEAGFTFDSSRILFREHSLYGAIELEGFEQVSRNVFRNHGFVEFQISTLDVAGRAIPISGGGYLRILPWVVMRSWIRKYLQTNELYVLYIHPFELSKRKAPPLPRETSYLNRFRFSFGRRSVPSRLKQLIQLLQANGFTFTTFANLRAHVLSKEASGME